MPWPDAALASFMSPLTSPDEIAAEGRSNCTAANATCPSREIWPGTV